MVFSHPSEKYDRQNGESSPNRGEHKKYLKPPPSLQHRVYLLIYPSKTTLIAHKTASRRHFNSISQTLHVHEQWVPWVCFHKPHNRMHLTPLQDLTCLYEAVVDCKVVSNCGNIQLEDEVPLPQPACQTLKSRAGPVRWTSPFWARTLPGTHGSFRGATKAIHTWWLKW